MIAIQQVISTSNLNQPAVQWLASQIHGEVILPGDSAWRYRQADFLPVIVGVGPDPANYPPVITWSQEYWRALHPDSAGAGMSIRSWVEGQARVTAVYHEHHARLAQVKTKYAPRTCVGSTRTFSPLAEDEKMDITVEQVQAGQAFYTRRNLAGYDFVVLGLSNQFIWRCPSRRIVEHYNRHVTTNHLDVGVGTGYFLDRCRYPSQEPRIALMDLNPDTLDYTSQRIDRYSPETYLRNVLEPIAIDGAKFDSVGVNYLLHCLPGSMESKAIVFDHLSALMNPNAVIFGSTLLQEGVSRSWIAIHLMDFYNKKRIFTNHLDSLEGLRQALGRRFREVSIEVVGCAALFSGRI